MSDRAQWTIQLAPARAEPSPRWVRVYAGDTEIANSRRAMLLVWYGPGMLPTYCFPPEDVRADLLVPSAEPGTGPEYVVDHDAPGAPNGARLFRSPPPPLDVLDGYWTFTWDKGLTWREEAIEIHVHARDTTKRVDAVPSARHIRVELDGAALADTHSPVAVFETTLPTRWYLPPADVNQDLLVPSDTVSRCPYKGTASYWSVQLGDTLHPDIAWFYPEPIPECPRIAGLVAFFNERVNIYVDGELEARPRTPWSDSPTGLSAPQR